MVPETRNQLNEMKDVHVPAANQLSFSPERLEAIRERFDPDVDHENPRRHDRHRQS